tara:strand:- start:1086 stop:1247 length:162 start_codon:yes stop_codon:yes gene_type:complete
MEGINQIIQLTKDVTKLQLHIQLADQAMKELRGKIVVLEKEFKNLKGDEKDAN